MKHIMDSQAIEEYAFQEGKEEGKKEIAKEMLKNDIDIEVVVQCTGLTKDEVKKLSLKQ